MERGGGAIPFRATNIAAAAGTPTSASTAGRPQQGDRENAVSAEIERRTTSQDEELELLFASLSI
uniref:Uncharacterized protein n=1 Tax=Oryza meridionalis TaxID=40149 RepID=A0A0E0D368_9ORYZ